MWMVDTQLLYYEIKALRTRGSVKGLTIQDTLCQMWRACLLISLDTITYENVLKHDYLTGL